MNHMTSNNNVWPCVLGGVALGAASALALAHAWRPVACQKKTNAPRRGLRVAVVLSGCGVYDGAEVQEATAALFHLSKQSSRLCMPSMGRYQLLAYASPRRCWP